MPDAQIRDWLAAHLAALEFLDASPHLAEYLDQAGAGRIEPDILYDEVATLGD